MEKITTATGIKAVVKFIAGEDCGCDERKAKLNALFPYKKPECLSEEEYKWWTNFREVGSNELTKLEMNMIVKIHARVFHHAPFTPCTCSPKKWQNLIKDINQVYDTYEETNTTD